VKKPQRTRYRAPKMITMNLQACNGETPTPESRTRRTVPMTSTMSEALELMSVIRSGGLSSGHPGETEGGPVRRIMLMVGAGCHVAADTTAQMKKAAFTAASFVREGGLEPPHG